MVGELLILAPDIGVKSPTVEQCSVKNAPEGGQFGNRSVRPSIHTYVGLIFPGVPWTWWSHRNGRVKLEVRGVKSDKSDKPHGFSHSSK